MRARPQDSRYAQALRDDPAIQRLASGDWPMEWSGNYRFIADDPLKISMEKRDAHRAAVSAVLLPAMRDAQSALDVISPYFVPGDKGSTGLVNTARAGSQVRILTNSLAANDVAAVHGGYSRYRKKLLKGGVQLWELKPLTGETKDSSLFGSSGASLHTKALSIDQKTLFVGSYNLDPRSTWLNCEQGVLVESPALVTQFRAIFEAQTAGSPRVARHARGGRALVDRRPGRHEQGAPDHLCAAHAGLVRASPEDRRPALGSRGTKVSFRGGVARFDIHGPATESCGDDLRIIIAVAPMVAGLSP